MPLKHHQHSFRAMGSPCEVQIYAADQALADRIFTALTDRIAEIEYKYSRYQSDSVVSHINRSAFADRVEVDEETADLIDFAERCFEQSGGLFDITSGILRRAWDFKAKKIPSSGQLGELLQSVGWQHVEWKRPHLRFTKPGMELDFGGVGKEYAVDIACGVLMRHSIEHGLVNFGGDIRTLGPSPTGEPWKIGVSHPRKERETVATILLDKGALATSGDYERYFEVNGKRYCHILDPKTGSPVESFQSVTVITDSCLAAGTLSTITMLFGEARGIKFLHDSGLRFICVKSDGSVVSDTSTNCSTIL